MASQQILPELWTPSAIAAEQAKLLAQATTDDTAIQACAAASSQFKTGWGSFFVALKTFCQTSYGWITTTNPDGTWDWGGGTSATVSQLQDYETALYQWELAAKSAQCTLVAPSVNPNTPTPATQAVETIVSYGTVALAFLSSAYIVSKLAGTVSLLRAGEREVTRSHRSR